MEKISCDVKGVSNDRLHRCWRNMHYRCTSPKHKMHKYYEHIVVCDEWKSYKAFADWSMGNGYADNLSIDRRDNSGDYEPDNCRWVTDKTNSRNTRRAITVTIDGVDMPLADACDLYGMPYGTIYTRYVMLGWGIDNALKTPIKVVNQKTPKMSKAAIMRIVSLREEGRTHIDIAYRAKSTIAIVQNILSGRTASKITGIKKRTKK